MDPVKSYFHDIKDIPLLTAKEEIELARRIKKGDKAAREKMIRSNLRLVISIAKRYVNLGIPFSDLIEEGNMGLMRGVDKFDPNRGFRFSTYAAWWIKQGISRAIIDQGKMIRVPVYLNEEILKYRKLVESMSQQMHRKPSASEIAKKMRIPIQRVRELEMAITKMSSLDASLNEEKSGQMKDILEDESLVAPDEEVELFLNKERASSLLETLEPRERTIIELRYGLIDGESHTLGRIGRKLGLSRERVRQIQQMAIRRLKRSLKDRERPS